MRKNLVTADRVRIFTGVKRVRAQILIKINKGYVRAIRIIPSIKSRTTNRS